MSKEQPNPINNSERPIGELVIEDIKERMNLGLARYGTLLQPFNGRDCLQDAYEEQLDFLQYFKQVIIEVENQRNNYKEFEEITDECIEDLSNKLDICVSSFEMLLKNIDINENIRLHIKETLSKVIDVCSTCNIPYHKCDC